MDGASADPPAGDGLRRAWKALRALPHSNSLPPRPPRDADAMTELLFDRFGAFDGSRFLYHLTDLQIDRLDARARAFRYERALLVDAGVLAEETACVMFQDALAGRRAKPLARWIDEAMERAAREAVAHPDLAPPTDLGATASDQRLIRAVAARTNRLDEHGRRIVWLHVVQRRDAKRIADELGIPFEHVEFTLERTVDESKRALAKPTRSRRRTKHDRHDTA